VGTGNDDREGCQKSVAVALAFSAPLQHPCPYAMKNGVIMETMMISRTEQIPAFSIRTGFFGIHTVFVDKALRIV
jgi:hypothetical protein